MVLIVKTDRRRVKDFCSKCHGVRNLYVLTQVFDDINDPEYQNHEYDYYQTVQCAGCEYIFYRTEYILHCGMEEDYTSSQLYPPASSEISQFSLGVTTQNIYSGKEESIERKIERVCKETYQSLSMNHHLLPAVGIRMMIEFVCQREGITDEIAHSLPKKLEKLLEIGKITQVQSAVLLEVKVLGDDAAHRGKLPSRKLLVQAMRILHNLMDGMYNLELKDTKTKNLA